MHDIPEYEQSPPEQLRVAGNEWSDLDAAAFLMAETKTSELARRTLEHAEEFGPMSNAKAEQIIKASNEWRAHLVQIADARRHANRARVYYDSLRTKFAYWQSQNANRREERHATRHHG